MEFLLDHQMPRFHRHSIRIVIVEQIVVAGLAVRVDRPFERFKVIHDGRYAWLARIRTVAIRATRVAILRVEVIGASLRIRVFNFVRRRHGRVARAVAGACAMVEKIGVLGPPVSGTGSTGNNDFDIRLSSNGCGLESTAELCAASE